MKGIRQPRVWGTLFACSLCICLHSTRLLRADAFVVTRAMRSTTIVELNIGDEGVVAELEIGEGDQEAFADLTRPGRVGNVSAGSRRDGNSGGAPESDLGPLPLDGPETWAALRVWADGEPLAGKVTAIGEATRVRRDEVTGDPLPDQDGPGEPVLRVRVEYPFGLSFQAGQRPRTLTFRPPQEKGQVTANVGFICYHRELPVNDFRYLASEITIDLDWEDPWYSSFRHPNLRRQFNSPLSAYLYVEPYEVRQEVIIRPMDLSHWTEISLPDDGRLPVAMQEGLKKSVVDFLIQRNAVEIDGKLVEPRLDRVNFIRRTLKSTGIIDPPETLDLSSATLGVIFYYPTTELPDEVSMRWELFSPRIQSVPSVASDEAGGLPTTLTPEQPVLSWRNYLLRPSSRELLAVSPPPPRPALSLPWISLACLVLLVVLLIRGAVTKGQVVLRWAVPFLAVVATVFWSGPRLTLPHPFRQPAPIPARQGGEILSALLYNVYRSFDHHDDAVIYDRLSEAIDGDLLEDVFLQTRRSMEVKNQGGLRISVKEVDVEGIAPQETVEGDPVFECNWKVSGWVGHWGHTHRRANEHVARIRLSDRGGKWKITEMDMIDQNEISPDRSTLPPKENVDG